MGLLVGGYGVARALPHPPAPPRINVESDVANGINLAPAEVPRQRVANIDSGGRGGASLSRTLRNLRRQDPAAIFEISLDSRWGA